MTREAEPDQHAPSLQRGVAESFLGIAALAAVVTLVVVDDRVTTAIAMAVGCAVATAVVLVVSLAVERPGHLDAVARTTSTPTPGWRRRSRSVGRRRGLFLVPVGAVYVPALVLVLDESWSGVLSISAATVAAIAVSVVVSARSMSRWEQRTGRRLFLRRGAGRFAWTSSQARRQLVAVDAATASPR